MSNAICSIVMGWCMFSKIFFFVAVVVVVKSSLYIYYLKFHSFSFRKSLLAFINAGWCYFAHITYIIFWGNPMPARSTLDIFWPTLILATKSYDHRFLSSQLLDRIYRTCNFIGVFTNIRWLPNNVIVKKCEKFVHLSTGNFESCRKITTYQVSTFLYTFYTKYVCWQNIIYVGTKYA